MDNDKRQTVDWRNRLEYGYSYNSCDNNNNKYTAKISV